MFSQKVLVVISLIFGTPNGVIEKSEIKGEKLPRPSTVVHEIMLDGGMITLHNLALRQLSTSRPE